MDWYVKGFWFMLGHATGIILGASLILAFATYISMHPELLN